MKKSKKAISEVLSDHQKVHIINETPKYKKLWLLLTNVEKRRALEESEDLWHFDEICRDIMDDRKE